MVKAFIYLFLLEIQKVTKIERVEILDSSKRLKEEKKNKVVPSSLVLEIV